MVALIALCHVVLVLVFTIRILLRDDLSPPARLAWFIVLNVLPYMGSVVYFLFGEIDLGHKADKRHAEVFSEIRAKAAQFMGQPDHAAIDPAFRPASLYAASINGFHPVTGNHAELMADANETVERLVADIDAATDHVHVLYYIWLTDNTGTALAEALIRAAKRGVTCRAMADGLGSRALVKSDLWRGSRNSADPEFLPKPKFAPWVDIMLRFTGPVVTQNQILFASDWMQATGESLDAIPLPPQPAKGGFPAQVMGDGPTERMGATPQLFATLIACAREELALSTPYFVPDATVLEALRAAALRGVRVTLILPERNDSWIVAAASHSYYHNLLEAGCKIHEFRGGLLHAKTLTIDGRLSLIGSTNLDLRSFDLNYENNILLQDRATTEAIRGRQSDYIASARPVTLEDVRGWSYRRRIWNNVIATIGPVL